MNKQSVSQDLKTVYKSGFINVSQVSKYLKISRESAACLLQGLDYFETGREKKYHVPDVAGRICDNRKI